MNTALARIAAFVVGLAVVFAGGLALGRTAGPDLEPVAGHDREGGRESPGHEDAGHDDSGHDDSGHLDSGHDDSGHEAEPGNGKHGDGISLALDRTRLEPGAGRRVTFRLLVDSGAPLSTYDEKHERELHLIVVGTPALTDYQHLHPTRDGDVWSVRMALAPGRYRVFADGRTGGADFVADATLRVAGNHAGHRATPAPNTRDAVGAYAVTLDAAADGTMTLRVTRGGQPVTDLQPYLGASGHLVVIRRGSLDYLHAHPEDGPPGPEVAFAVDFAKPGVHRLFFDFKHDGKVRTAAFTLRVGGGHGDGDGGGGHEH